MSDYRDDTQDTLIAGDSVFTSISSIVEDIVRVAEAMFVSIGILCATTVCASDEVIDEATFSLSEIILASDESNGALSATKQHFDLVRVSDHTNSGTTLFYEDTIIASDNIVAATVMTAVSDTAVVSDSLTEHRIAASLVVDTIKITDSVTSIYRDMSDDSTLVSDSATDTLLASDLVDDSVLASSSLSSSVSLLITDSIIVSDLALGQRSVLQSINSDISVSDKLLFNRAENIVDQPMVSSVSTGNLNARQLTHDALTATALALDNMVQSAVAVESVKTSDDVIDTLSASGCWQDVVVAQEDIISIGGYYGQAWTANTDSWAMSRYEPYNYRRLVVINNVLYGEADDGIYRLDHKERSVSAAIKTGKMDLGKGALTHPISAYLEYELSGEASMTVYSTQKGQKQQHVYLLPSEQSEELTNGRFVFGRGLRGRHFSFELSIIGTHGHINDLSIDHAPTSRRV